MNAGIFLFPFALLMHARELEPKMLAAVQLAVDDAREDKSFWHIDQASWSKILEKSLITQSWNELITYLV